MTNRKRIIQEITEILNTNGFKTSNIYDQGSFDIVARKNLDILVIKAFTNIDSVNDENIEEMKKLASIFLASPIIIGEKSRNGNLEEGVVYERYDIPAISLDTFRNIIYFGESPEILADRGGYYVKIDGNVLKRFREEFSLSLKELADLAHVSRATMYKYENKIVRANTETAIQLEKVLNTKITLDIDIFKSKQKDSIKFNPTKDSEDLSKLGFGVISTQKSPFDTVAKIENKKTNPLIANLEKNRNEKTLKKMVIPLKDLSLITSSNPVFIINNENIGESFDEIPVVRSWEIKEFKSSKELFKLIEERKES